MFNRDQLQARAYLGVYPEVPSGWPNRETRRAVKGNRLHRLSSEWRQLLVTRPQLTQLIQAL